MKEENIQIRLIIRGRVQGVYFRSFTKKNAEQLGIFGWVKNREDKAVEALLQGPEKVVEEMKKLLQKGPVAAQVDQIEEVESKETQMYHSFSIVK